MKKTVMIATPMYGGMCTGHYAAGVIGNINYLSSRGFGVYWAQIMNESLITRARNELARVFIETGHDYLMFVDADISFPADSIHKLIEADKDIVCGLYPKKEIDWAQINQAAKEGKDNLQDFAGAFVLNMSTEDPYKHTNEQGLLEVRHGGTGFMLIKREVFEKLAPHVPEYRTATFKDANGEFIKPLTKEFFATSIDATGALLSEDYHFCELWGKHGGTIYANPFIKLEHVGTYVFSGNIIRAGGNLK